jgi:hypothetical protein
MNKRILSFEDFVNEGKFYVVSNYEEYAKEHNLPEYMVCDEVPPRGKGYIIYTSSSRQAAFNYLKKNYFDSWEVHDKKYGKRGGNLQSESKITKGNALDDTQTIQSFEDFVNEDQYIEGFYKTYGNKELSEKDIEEIFRKNPLFKGNKISVSWGYKGDEDVLGIWVGKELNQEQEDAIFDIMNEIGFRDSDLSGGKRDYSFVPKKR